MQIELYITVILLTLCELVYSFPQNEIDSLSFKENEVQPSLISNDSISEEQNDKKPLLTDLLVIMQRTMLELIKMKKAHLYDNAEFITRY